MLSKLFWLIRYSLWQIIDILDGVYIWEAGGHFASLVSHTIQ